jgi:light-regulated signal transduction histidine kinase (bacteriophytochrome)
LTQQAEELWRSNRELEQFAYVSSHDLKEPLRKIASYTQLLEQRFSERLDVEGKRYLSHVLNGVDRMQSLIHDLLVYSRTGKEEMRFEPVDMKRIVQQAVGDLETSMQENGAEVTMDDLPVIEAQPAQMHQLFQNLISNAIKFHGAVSPRVHVSARKEGEEWIFRIKDNGIGIDPKYQEQIFKIFQRLHSRNEYPGTGIGLAICKKIVERHGGRIWVESTPGDGSSFLFSVPVHIPVPATAEGVNAAPSA